jgi:hypothetical protein
MEFVGISKTAVFFSTTGHSGGHFSGPLQQLADVVPDHEQNAQNADHHHRGGPAVLAARKANQKKCASHAQQDQVRMSQVHDSSLG